MRRWVWVVAALAVACGESPTGSAEQSPSATIRAFWVEPADGDDTFNEAIRDSILAERAIHQKWAVEHMGARLAYAPDPIEVVRIDETAGAASGMPHLFIARVIQPLLAPDQVALVFYDGHSVGNTCGSGGDRIAALYLGSCNEPFLRRSEFASIGSGFWIYAAVHDLGHVFGAYPPDADHFIGDGHHDQRGYLMYGFGQGVPYKGALPATVEQFKPYLETSE